MTSAKTILLQILEEADQKQYSVRKTHLVKLLYLVEVEYFRETSERLTDLEWLFYHYGPYAHELNTILEERDFDPKRLDFEDGKTAVRYRVAETAKSLSPRLDPKVSLIVKRVVGLWGDKPLAQVLDYVYFETEPMEAVERRGQKLDFGTIKKEPSGIVVPLKASRETERKVAELRKRIAPVLATLAARREAGSKEDKHYEEAMKAWSEEMDKDADPEALKRISITVTKPAEDSV